MGFRHVVEEILPFLWHLATLAAGVLPHRPFQTGAQILDFADMGLELELKEVLVQAQRGEGLSQTSGHSLCFQHLIRPKRVQFGGHWPRNKVRDCCCQDRRGAGTWAGAETSQKSCRVGARAGGPALAEGASTHICNRDSFGAWGTSGVTLACPMHVFSGLCLIWLQATPGDRNNRELRERSNTQQTPGNEAPGKS